MGIRYDFGEILVALIILGQHPQVIGLMILTPRLFIIFMVCDHVSFTSDDRFDPAFLGLLDEIDGTKKITMIGQGHG